MNPYQVGEIVLMNWQGWLKAFRVVGVREIDDEHIEYQMAMLEMEHDRPAWTRRDA